MGRSGAAAAPARAGWLRVRGRPPPQWPMGWPSVMSCTSLPPQPKVLGVSCMHASFSSWLHSAAIPLMVARTASRRSCNRRQAGRQVGDGRQAGLASIGKQEMHGWRRFDSTDAQAGETGKQQRAGWHVATSSPPTHLDIALPLIERAGPAVQHCVAHALANHAAAGCRHARRSG